MEDADDDSWLECNCEWTAHHWSDDDQHLETNDNEERIPFRKDVENVERPISWLPLSSDVAQDPKVHTTGLYCTLYLIGDELGDGGDGGADTGVLTRDSPLGDDGSTSAADTEGLTVDSLTLTDDVVEEVLLRLPAAAQARCRALCTAWRDKLTDPGFPRRSFLKSLSRTTPPPLCGLRHCVGSAYQPRIEGKRGISPLLKALEVNLSHLPEVFHSNDSILYNCSPSGFMCIVRRIRPRTRVAGEHREETHVCVFNPLNQSFKVLPVLQSYHYVVLMGTVTATGSIPSFMVHVSEFGPRTIQNVNSKFKDVAIYSSISGEWKCFKSFPEVEVCPGLAWAFNGDAYAVVNCIPPRLVRLSMEKGPRYLWDVALPDFEKRRDMDWQVEFHLVEYDGRLLCCYGGIWRLDDAGQQWIEIAGRCPPDLLPAADLETQRLVVDRVRVSEDLVVFFYQIWFRRSKTKCNFFHGLRRKVDCPVAYDMRRRRWRKVPKIVGQVKHVFQPMPNLSL